MEKRWLNRVKLSCTPGGGDLVFFQKFAFVFAVLARPDQPECHSVVLWCCCYWLFFSEKMAIIKNIEPNIDAYVSRYEEFTGHFRGYSPQYHYFFCIYAWQWGCNANYFLGFNPVPHLVHPETSRRMKTQAHHVGVMFFFAIGGARWN